MNKSSYLEYSALCGCLTLHSFMHSNLSLASEDADSPESILIRTSGSFSDGSRTRPFERPSANKQFHLHDIPVKGEQSSPASLSGSLSDIPVLLINGAPQPDLGIQKSGPEMDLLETLSESRSKPCFPQSASQKKIFNVFHFWMDWSLFCYCRLMQASKPSSTAPSLRWNLLWILPSFGSVHMSQEQKVRLATDPSKDPASWLILLVQHLTVMVSLMWNSL